MRRIGEDCPMADPSETAIVFDIGGVLLDWDPRYLYDRLFDDPDEMERFLAEICTLEWHAAHDRGVPFERSCAELAQRHPEYAEMIWAWGRRSEEMIAGPIDGTVQLLRELQEAGVRCYALTNMETETYALRRERFAFMTWFDGTVVSSHEGVVKPEPEIFELLLRRFGLRPQATLLIDDAQRNVDAARALGIRAIHFQSPEALRRQLTELELLPPFPPPVARTP
jgi:2-haloacid dehalogenase